MSVGPFDWDRGDLTLPQTDATAVYREGDVVVIRQRDAVQDDEAVIVIPIDFAEKIADAIRSAAKGDAFGG